MTGYLKLHPHPEHPSPSIRITAEAIRPQARQLNLVFRVEGEIERLSLPPRCENAGFSHNLWQQTCFEAFLKPADAHGYFEFNFAPSGAWAGYYLTDYRDIASFTFEAPRVRRERTPLRYEFRVELAMAKSLKKALWHLNLAAVIEEKSGRKSYWALAHPPEGPPDFHHPACFVLELPPP